MYILNPTTTNHSTNDVDCTETLSALYKLLPVLNVLVLNQIYIFISFELQLDH